MKSCLLPLITWMSLGLGLLGGISSMAIYEREKLNKRIQTRKDYQLETFENINQYLKSGTVESKISPSLPIISRQSSSILNDGNFDITIQDESDESEEEIISGGALFPSAFVPYCDREALFSKKTYMPKDLWEEVKRTSQTQNGAFHVAGLTLGESTWDKTKIADLSSQGSFGYTQVNQKYHYKTATAIHPDFFSDEKIWQDPYYNIAAFRRAFESTSSQQLDWYYKMVAYNVGPDLVGPPNYPNRGIKYADKISTYVSDFKTQLDEFITTS